MPEARTVKCVVWDLDDTLWSGVALEEDRAPEPREEALALLDELGRRGIVSSVASRADPSLLDLLERDPRLRGSFVVPQVGWAPKSASIARIVQLLNIGADAVAFVDDSAFERAEVRFSLPDVLVLSPPELAAAMATPAFSAGAATAEAGRRGAMYRDEERRRTAEAGFEAGRPAFLAWCDMRLTIGHPTAATLDRLLELAARTHQLNSSGRRPAPEEADRWLGPGPTLAVQARLVDRFGDYGVIGMALVDRGAAPGEEWTIELLALSCRVEGRGIPAALLTWLLQAARAAGVPAVRARYVRTDRNLRLAVLFRQLGFRPVAGEAGMLRRRLDAQLPTQPAWLSVVGTPP